MSWMIDEVHILFKIDEIYSRPVSSWRIAINYSGDVMWRGDDVFCVTMEIVIQDYEESQK